MNLQAIKQRFGIIGRSAALDNSLSTAIRVAPTDLTVLVTGKSGVGKEVFSKIIHALSPRKHNKFIAINCGAIPEGTINSELFGHEKGAFTGSTGDRKGYFETVNGGTIFLDEIGEMPLDTQTFLLRILESGEFLRVGSSKTLKSDVRIIAATNVELLKKVRQGKFREDLYYRLSTVPIKVPSLQERPEDIYLLFRKFASDFAEKYRSPLVQLDDQAQSLLKNYAWPGNIRQLKNIAYQISVLSKDRLITVDALLNFIPDALHRNLPALSDHRNDNEPRNLGSGYERELIYKFLYDMRQDISDLKGMLFELARTNNLHLPDMDNIKQRLPALPPSSSYKTTYESINSFRQQSPNSPSVMHTDNKKPIIIDKNTYKDNTYKEAEEVEENLSLEDMEKDFIMRALKKHKGKRKEAASELGISERTLYRKIRQYHILE